MRPAFLLAVTGLVVSFAPPADAEGDLACRAYAESVTMGANDDPGSGGILACSTVVSCQGPEECSGYVMGTLTLAWGYAHASVRVLGGGLSFGLDCASAGIVVSTCGGGCPLTIPAGGQITIEVLATRQSDPRSGLSTATAVGISAYFESDDAAEEKNVREK